MRGSSENRTGVPRGKTEQFMRKIGANRVNGSRAAEALNSPEQGFHQFRQHRSPEFGGTHS